MSPEIRCLIFKAGVTRGWQTHDRSEKSSIIEAILQAWCVFFSSVLRQDGVMENNLTKTPELS